MWGRNRPNPEKPEEPEGEDESSRCQKSECDGCKGDGICPIQDLAPWLDEHMEEADNAKKDCASSLAKACNMLANKFPPVALVPEDIGAMATTCFLIGYQKAKREAPPIPIPRAFEDM